MARWFSHRWLLLLAALALLAPRAAQAQEQRVQGWCEAGAQKVSVSGLLSSNQVQGSFPACTVTVYLTGTTTLASISDSPSGSPAKANPFTASSVGQWGFYAGPGGYDIQLSGTGMSTTTLTDVSLPLQNIGVQTVAFTATPSFNIALYNTFQMTLTGNVTSSSVVNAAPGEQINFQIAQDATGGRTFAWPANFQNAPTILSGASAITNASFVFDGTHWNAVVTAINGGPVQLSSGANTGTLLPLTLSASRSWSLPDESGTLIVNSDNPVTGTLTAPHLPVATGAHTLSDSGLSDDGTTVSTPRNVNIGGTLTSASPAITPTSIEPWELADQHTGATPAAKILSAFTSTPATIAIPGSLGDGQPTSPWQASTAFAVGAYVLDANGGIEKCTTAGTTASSQPTWNTTVGGTTTDGSVTWTLQPGNVLATSLFDFRMGSSTSKTTGRGVFPYSNIWLPLWDDSSANPANSAPFEPLNNSAPIAFGTQINEYGSANPAAFFGAVSGNSTGLGYVGNIATGLFNCALNSGDTHGGCWGINEGVSSSSTLQTLQGNEVNLFNNSGTDANNSSGVYNAGPYFGFEATSSGSNRPTAAFMAESSVATNNWWDGLFDTGSHWAGVECGHPGVTSTSVFTGGCIVSNAKGTATASNNYASYSITLDAASWNGSANETYFASEAYEPASGTNPQFAWTWRLSQPGTPSEIPVANIGANGSVNAGVSLSAGFDSTNSVTVAGSSSGSPVTVTATGSDANIGIRLVPKGTGAVSDASGNSFATASGTLTSGIVLLGAGGSAVKASTQAFSLSGANGLSAFSVTLVAGTGSHTFTAAYTSTTAPVCTASDQTTGTNAAGAVATGSANNWTAVTVTGTGTDVISVHCSPAVN